MSDRVHCKKRRVDTVALVPKLNYSLPLWRIRQFHTNSCIFDLIKVWCDGTFPVAWWEISETLQHFLKRARLFLLVIVLYHKHIAYYRSAYSSTTVYFPFLRQTHSGGNPCIWLDDAGFLTSLGIPRINQGARRVPRHPTSTQCRVEPLGFSGICLCRGLNTVKTWWVNYRMLVFVCILLDMFFLWFWWQIGQSRVEFTSIFWACRSWEVQKLCQMVLHLHFHLVRRTKWAAWLQK